MKYFDDDIIGSKAPPTDQWADLPLAAGSLAVHEATEAGIQAVHDHADNRWKQTAYAALVSVARHQAKLSADDVWKALEGSTPTTHNASALGPLFRIAANNGLIKKAVGELVKTRFERRHRELQVWDSLVRDVPIPA
ncbi:MAG TPA: hypothetical protein VGI97_14845 [Gemmatimonadaceae bacterium]|jgi:hypothetical protein